MADSTFLTGLSYVFGWTYFTCWSLSFYPQSILNFSRKSTSGTTIDFPLINCLGFFAYTVSNIAFVYSPLIRAQYAARYKGLTPTVQFNDITFAFHGLLLCFVTVSQYLFPRAWAFAPSLGSRPSHFILGTFFGCVAGTLIIILRVWASSVRSESSAAVTGWIWLDAIYAVSYVKLVVTLIKYTPQMYVNYRNKSTVGWSILQILLDFGGGILSISQQAIDSYQQGDWSGITGNPVKFALGNVSMIYDLVFIVQHYVLYRHAGVKMGRDGDEGSDSDPLLGDDGRGGDEERRIQ
ncbi:PQ loop repeat-domain-containing protein [Pseudoneurospora amorphoporcata]|uniref:PQ loop repeat-domain-containing protein n=1 Tax=Pseudoneurospora amorphoporcata TaxID=241081 RepID=A0AAN6NMD0_9PEZI|nr:PQ loop repeat-domain-containing protein [Pseudoneurospora amorphoporcata]